MGFEVVEGLSASLVPGASDSFTLRLLSGEVVGERSGSVSLTTNDPSENPFDFPVRGEVVATTPPPPPPPPSPPPPTSPPGGTPGPEVAVTVNGTSIASGATLDLGTRNPGEPAPSATLTFRNDGTADLQLGAVVTPAGYALAGVPASGVLATGASAELTVTLVATEGGTFAGAMAMPTNDADENPFTLNLTGAVSSTLPAVGGIAVATVAASRIPVVVISGGGGKSPRGTLAVTLRNESGGAFVGLVIVAIRASSDAVLDAGDAQLVTVPKTLKFRAGATGRPIKLKVPLGALPAGQQTLLATATANNVTTTGAPGPTVSVEPARVNLVGLPGAGPAAGKPLAVGKRATLSVPLQNTGNVATSRAPATYTLVFTTDGTEAGKVFETTSVAKVSLKPGASKPHKLSLTLPPATSLPAGTYTLLVRLSADLNQTNGETVALLPVTIA